MTTSPNTHAIDTPHARIHFLTFGNPNGIPVLLLHGFPDSPAAYTEVIAHLDRKHLHLFVPYLRGFGQTTINSPDLVTGQEAALGHDLLAFADAVGLRRFHLVGHDWGARTAYAACLFAPERVVSLLTLATPYVMYGGKPYPPPQVNANWYQWFFQLELGRTMLHTDAVAFCHQLWRSWSPDWNFSESDFEDAAQAWSNPQFAETVLGYYRTRWGGALSNRAYAELQAQLNASPKAKITVPAMYVQGGADNCDLPACSEDQATFFTASYERVLLKGLGHFPHREDPKAIAKLITRHLDAHA